MYIFFQMHEYRACQLSKLGVDHSLLGNVAVVLINDLQPYMSGCVSLDNQVIHLHSFLFSFICHLFTFTRYTLTASEVVSTFDIFMLQKNNT